MILEELAVAALIAYAVGFGQVFLVAFQVRQLSAGHRGWVLFVTSLGISSFWVLGVRSVVSSGIAAPAYVLGAATGTLVASRVRIRDRNGDA